MNFVENKTEENSVKKNETIFLILSYYVNLIKIQKIQKS